MRKIIAYLLGAGFALLLGSAPAVAQRVSQPASIHYNSLYQYGIGPAFLGGLFREGLPVSQFKRHGSFGIAAPALVDGELIAYDGRVYQTTVTGGTAPAPDTLRVPFGMTCFFKSDTSFRLSQPMAQAEVQQLLDKCLRNKNGIYAVRITGVFAGLKTRAFHRVATEPFPPIAAIQAAQQVFSYQQLTGTMFGFRMPAYMSSVNGTGYHFHFLAAKLDKGGHVLDFAPAQVLVEIAQLHDVTIDIPTGKAFSSFSAKTP